jgi:hypothetical protein
MENQDILELINAFLDQELSEEQVREVESRMTKDVEFRKNVELQKDIRKAYRHAGRIRLRNSMTEVMKESIPEEDPFVSSVGKKTRYLVKLLMLLAAVVIILVVIWFVFRPDKTAQENSSPSTEQSTSPSSKDADTQMEQEIVPIEDNQQEPEDEQTTSSETRYPIAMADPADFAPNPTMEAMIRGEFRSGEGIFLELTSPSEDAFFNLQGDENQTVTVLGTLSGLEVGQQLNLVLLFFDNKDINNPILEFSFEVEGKEAGTSLNLSPSLSSRPGLYYLMIETEEGDLLAAGKFKLQ